MAERYIDETNDMLSKIDFGKLLASPIEACVDAQAAACVAASKYIKEFGFVCDSNVWDAKHVVFFFTAPDGKRKKLTVPLISLVPLPYLQIKDINLDFKTQVSVNESGRIVGKMSPRNKYVNNSSFQSDLSVNVGIKASVSDMPIGVARVLEIMGDNISFKSVEKVAHIENTDK